MSINKRKTPCIQLNYYYIDTCRTTYKHKHVHMLQTQCKAEIIIYMENNIRSM